MPVKVSEVAKAVEATLYAVDKIETWRTKYKEYVDGRRHKISISETDRIYFDVLAWLVSLPSDTGKLRSWGLKSNFKGEVQYPYNGKTAISVKIDGHNATFMTKTGEKPGGVDDGLPNMDEMMAATKYTLTITVDNVEAAQAVKRNIDRIAAERKNRDEPPSLHVYSRWGWEQSEAPMRTLDSVVLDTDIKETLANDIRRFLGAEKEYVQRGLPWHRGVLLYGPPGTGKTSLIKGLANEFSLDVYFLSVADMKSDGELIEKIHAVKPGSIVLFEDVDSVDAATDREAKGVTTSGLLNVLDGIFTPHGMIGVLTTNHVDKLDPAVVRPGRVDVKVLLDYCTRSQIVDLYETFYSATVPGVVNLASGAQISAAQVSEVFKRNLYDAEAGFTELLELVDG